MTTPQTPANWYPDPEDAASLRYWDGTSWTEHRAPAVAPEAPAPTPEAASEPEVEPEAAPPAQPVEQPTSVISTRPDPLRDPLTSVDPLPGEAAPAELDRPTPSVQRVPEGQPAAPSEAPPTYQQPPAAPYPPAYPPQQPYQQPTGSGGSNKKVLFGILGGVAAIALVAALVLVYFFVIKDDDTVKTASPTTSSSSKSSTSSSKKSTTAKSAAPTSDGPGPIFVPPPGGAVVSGSLSFSISDIKPATKVTATFSDQVSVTAKGTYAIVYLDVKNVGTESTTFLASLQKLDASGQTLSPDDQATAYLSGTFADVEPGQQVRVPVVFDVPDNATPDSLTVIENPVTPPAQLAFTFE